eukprot:Protomagalhaensia_wolfi_Nauph_80__2976@NODE_3050_length_909_cov_40_140230_g2391_i0_p1_GENE_NODE_3050_length_909_cov_40_140230_g2391_i0NODE_3050_length_909_cov_40_140230_g2391_i0_p1_ORF_typecomplete_len231_score47_50TMP_2/PF06791_13/4_8e02TMP_2/PF06791_13/1HisKA_4TM/PF16926_5/12HisKA_4TM/PF16926_5/6_4YfhO/PF09586_10/2_8Wzy_C/PF04932_15/9_8e02Wzy_C/PF04932_15/14_NODE_3050_length_909_cov_40_140230_g2391_i0137829
MSEEHRLIKRLCLGGAVSMILAGAVASFIQAWWQGIPLYFLALTIIMFRNERGWTLGGVSIGGACLSAWQFYRRVRGLIEDPRSVLRVVVQSIGAAAALAAFVLLVIVIAKCSQEAKSLKDKADAVKNAAAQKEPTEIDLEGKPMPPPPTPPTDIPPNLPPYPAVYPYGPPVGHLQPAHLVTHPGAPPQQILIAGPPPPELTAGTLYPVGHAYVPYAPPQPPPDHRQSPR